ncbi:MAG: hypothetical protein ACPGJV_12925 [Bacteriovoracaceae bacterium]
MTDLFPIIDRENHYLISLDGYESKMIEIEGIDFDQLDQESSESFFNDLSDSLDSLKDGELIKFYSIQNRHFIQLNKESNLNFNLKTKPLHDSLELFFGDSEINSNIVFYDNYLTINNDYLKLISIKEFSNLEINQSFLPEDLEYVVMLRKIAHSDSEKMLESKRNSSSVNDHKYKKDIQGQLIYDQAESLLHRLKNGETSLFNMEMYILVRANSLSELNNKTNIVIEYFRLNKTSLFIEGHNPFKGKTGIQNCYRSLIPGVNCQLNRRNIPNITDHLKYLLPVNKSFIHDEGIEFFDQRDNPIFLDIRNPMFKNKNTLISGPSGVGKSFLANILIQGYANEIPSLIIDQGGSFRRTTRYFGGVELHLALNPMQFKEKYFLADFITSVCGSNVFNKLERGKLLKHIEGFLETNDTNKFFDLIEHLEESYFKDLSLYFEPIKEYFSEDVIPFKKILYVDLEKYPKEILKPLLLNLLQYYENIESPNKQMVIDEVIEHLETNARFVDQRIRKDRKKGGNITIITQLIDDLIIESENDDRHIGSSLINNAHLFFLFPQVVERCKHISYFDKEKMNQCRFKKGYYSECYFKTFDSEIRKIIKIRVTPLRIELNHTEKGADEGLNNYLEEYSKFYNNEQEAIDAYVGMKYVKNITNEYINDYIWE